MSKYSGYRLMLPGPDLSTPFRVLEGLVVVHLERHRSVVIPVGGSWPGSEHLPEVLVRHLKPEKTSCFPGTRTEPDDETGRPAGLALVMAQALTAIGALTERQQLAADLGLDLEEVNQRTAGLAIGTTREAFSRKKSD